ncbi:MAG: 16S rRNA (guanine(966)-N(2))-methyltransferase RsmD [Caldilineaceae bacterium]
MRVITGRAKGRKLMSVPGDSTRPITDRAKSALFSILSDWIEGTRVLDLFGGTGGVGIECLSRGAAYAHFVDNNRKAVDTIQANLAHCGFSREATVERNDSFTFLERYRGEPFDFIYVAPPQYQDLWRKALQMIDQRPQLTAEYATIVVQIHPVEDKPVELQRLQEYDRRKYGSVMMLFYADAADLEEKGGGTEGSADDYYAADEGDE